MLGPEPVKVVRSAIDEALELLQDTPYGKQSSVTAAESPQSLLEQCMALCEAHRAAEPEPIRTIHHFACTGGTLIAKCLASMPNTQLLSEVDPLSEMGHAGRGQFFPTDLAGLVRSGTRQVDDALLIEIFLRGLSALYENAKCKGGYLILRDHAHSHFCVGSAIKQRPTLREIVAERYPVRSIITVRHPLDSYLSLKNMAWLHFDPPTVDEYARRYFEFLNAYQDCEVFRYEDFVEEPTAWIKRVCEQLHLSYNDSFTDIFSVHSISGDSGRKGGTISERRRRPVSGELNEEIRSSTSFLPLCEQLGYVQDVLQQQ